MKLDRRDVQILLVLQQDARCRMADLAKRINLSVTATWQRVKRLEEAGVIGGYHARVDLQRFAVNITGLYVTVVLAEHTKAARARFEAAIEQAPEIVACHAIAGGFDYIMHFLVNTIAHYQQLMEDLLDASIGIRAYSTHVVTKSIKAHNCYSAELINLVRSRSEGSSTDTEQGGYAQSA